MQYIIRLEWFIILVLLQVLVLNHIHFEQYATPLFYIYFLLKIDSDNSRKGLMLWAFSLGLCIDIFSNTPGLNAATAVCTAFCRPWILRLFSLRDITDNFEPGMYQMGFASFFRYTIVLVLLHAFILNILDTFSLANMPTLLLKIARIQLSRSYSSYVLILSGGKNSGKKLRS